MNKKVDYSAFAYCCRQLRLELQIDLYQFADMIALNPNRLIRFEEEGNIHGARGIAQKYVTGLAAYGHSQDVPPKSPLVDLWSTMLKTWLAILG